MHITLKPVNDAPTIVQITSGEGGWTMEEDTTASFDFVVADAETAVNGLIIKITSLDPSIIKTEQIALSTSESGNKTITVTPEANAHGEAPRPTERRRKKNTTLSGRGRRQSV